MKDVTVLLVLESQKVRFVEDTTIQVVRCPSPDFYESHWLAVCELADWIGFADDYGTFIPVDWC